MTKKKRRPLSQRERRWLERLEKLLMNPPTKRLGFYTIGDPNLTVYDTRFQVQIDELYEDGQEFIAAVYELEADLAEVRAASSIHAVRG